MSDLGSLQAFLLRRPTILSPEHVDELFRFLSEALPPYDVDEATIEALFALDEQELTGLGAALKRPIEDWTVFLHPEQTPLVRRTYSGPARIGGPAGTGKTSVGLHWLAGKAATRPGRMLWVTFVRTLAPVMKEAYRRLSPETVDRVEFTHVHGLATAVLKERGIRYRMDPKKAAEAFRVAWARVGKPQGLGGTGCSQDYYAEEIEAVIKGRGLASLEEYLGVRRIGRRTAFNAARREIVWQLACAYDEELAARGIVDMDDLLVMARDELRRQPQPTYASIVVDEAQDLTLVGVQLLQLLAGGVDETDSLLLLGDGQQAVYAGGWNLSEARISVSGRATVLKHNHRNTVEILAAASTFLAGDPFDDLDGEGQPAHRGLEVLRHGEDVVDKRFRERRCPRSAARRRRACRLWRGSTSVPGTSPCCSLPRRCGLAMRKRCRQWPAGGSTLRHVGRDTTQQAIKVGTYHRSKGLEFKHVFLPRLEVKTKLLTSGGSDEAVQREKAELAHRNLFVAATRARDGLWLGRVG